MHADFERLAATRPTSSTMPNVASTDAIPPASAGESPSGALSSEQVARTGHDLAVSATVSSSTRIKSVRLRYRHLTQDEDYETMDMALDAATRTYKGRIPAAFIDPRWDLMYFVEVIDDRGRGRMLPDLDKETPYVVVSVRR